MENLIQKLSFIDSTELVRDAAWQMAVDEAILRLGLDVTVRFYQWERRTISFGYFLKRSEIASVADRFGEIEWVRRWTGGGVVDHDGDVPYSIIVPAESEFFKLRPTETYRFIHQALVASLRAHGIPAELVNEEQGDGLACFEHPVPSDVLLMGKKIAGAGQRRTRLGMLHQGTIQGVSGKLVPEWRLDFAKSLAREVEETTLAPAVEALADQLRAEKYATEGWLNLR